MPDVPEPGPCPHCGAEAALAAGFFPKHEVGREFVTETINWVYCKGCGATGGTGRNALEAIKKWCGGAKRFCGRRRGSSAAFSIH